MVPDWPDAERRWLCLNQQNPASVRTSQLLAGLTHSTVFGGEEHGGGAGQTEAVAFCSAQTGLSSQAWKVDLQGNQLSYQSCVAWLPQLVLAHRGVHILGSCWAAT
jgi:hypothetical protein